jgi:hypothetical protein
MMKQGFPQHHQGRDGSNPGTRQNQITHLHRFGQSMTRIDQIMANTIMPARHVVCRHSNSYPQNRREDPDRFCQSHTALCVSLIELKLSGNAGVPLHLAVTQDNTVTDGRETCP